MREGNEYVKALWLLLGGAAAIIGFFLLMLLLGCNPSKKAQRELEKAKAVLSGNIVEAARFCRDKFPDKTEYVKGDSVIVFDTLYVGEVVFDTLETKDTVIITKNLPGKVITKTVRVTDTIKIEDRAKLIAANADLNDKIGEVAVLKNEVSELKKNVAEWKEKAKKRWWLWVVIVALIGWNFRKQIFKLIKPI